jgi:L-fuculose-phosphate aldolase
MMAGEAEARCKLVQGFHILDRYGLSSKIAGHLTARHPTRDAFWTHRFDLGFAEVGVEDLVLADFDLTVDGDATINPTLHIHAQIYRARPDVRAIVHTHGENVVALSATGVEFAPCSQMSAIFHDDVRTYEEENLIVLTAEQGRGMAAALGPLSTLILRHHGSLVAAASIEEAVLRTMALEDAAAIQLKAMAAGRWQPLSAGAAAQVKQFVLSPEIVDRYWSYETRMLASVGPSAPANAGMAVIPKSRPRSDVR